MPREVDAEGEEFVLHRNLTIGEGDGEGWRYGGRSKLRSSRVGGERKMAVTGGEEDEFGLVACGVEDPGDGRGGTVCVNCHHVMGGHARRPVAPHRAGDHARSIRLHLKCPLFASGDKCRSRGTDR